MQSGLSSSACFLVRKFVITVVMITLYDLHKQVRQIDDFFRVIEDFDSTGQIIIKLKVKGWISRSPS